MDLQDPHVLPKPGHMSVTLKHDGKDGTWIVFHGIAADIRKQIIDAFDMQGQEDAPLYDLINEATRVFKSTGNITSSLGGRVVGGKKSEGAPPSGGGSAWQQAAAGNAGEEEEPVDINVVRLTKAIEEVTDVTVLKELYARNKAHFDGNAELFAEWQAKGRALSS